LIAPENLNFGDINARDYLRLFSFARGGYFAIFVYLLLAIIAMGNQLLVSLFIATWTDLDFEEQQNPIYPKILFGLIVAYIVTSIFRSYWLTSTILSATENIHRTMATRIMRSPILFFDSNPVGRVLTRFSKELVILDSMIGSMIAMITQSFARTIGVVISVITVNWIIIFPVLVAVCYMTYVMKKGKKTMIDA
jgi:ABC-type multidrug transport system fused ATPase/permease subunit